jgi:hypothetical protein
MRLSYENITAPAFGVSGVPPEGQALLSGITTDAAHINLLAGVTGNVQSRLNLLVSSGGTLTGNVTLNGAPNTASHAATKQYVDTLVVSGKLPLSGGTMTGLLTLSGSATSALGAITKQQMETAIAGATSSGGSGLTEAWPRWNTNPSEQVGAGWTTFQAKLQALIAEVRKEPMASYNKISLVNANTGGGTNYNGGVLLPDGRVFYVPCMSTTARIYDPVTDSITVPTGAYAGGGAFQGGVLMADGRVYISPYNSTTARIYDPVTDTLTTPAGTFTGGGSNMGALLMKDGRVFICGYTGISTSKIYNPTLNTLVTVSTPPFAVDVRGGATLLPDGRIFLCSYIATVGGGSQGTRAVIYDPSNDTWGSEIIIESTVVAGFGHGILMADGRVYLPAYNSTTARIYDPVANVTTTPTGVFSGSAAHVTGTLLPDGRVYLVPYNTSTPARIYDPYTDTTITLAGSYPGIGYANALLLPDGRLFLIPVSSGTAAIIQNSTVNLSGNKKLPNNMILSPLLMRGHSRS